MKKIGMFVAFLVVLFSILIAGRNHIDAMQALMLTNEIKKIHTISIADKDALEHFKKLPDPAHKPTGLYTGQANHNIKVSYYFDGENDIKKEWEVMGRHTLSGSAKYKFDGATMVFYNPAGDDNMFSDLGEIAILDSPEEVLIEDKGYSFLLRKKDK